MPNIEEAFPSQFLRACDLKGATTTVTIEKVLYELVGRERETKPVVYFVGKTKGVVLNKTNARKITELAGSGITEEWTGVAIALYPTETEFSGEMVDCIRVKAAPRGSQAKIPLAPPALVAPIVPDLRDDEIPF